MEIVVAAGILVAVFSGVFFIANLSLTAQRDATAKRLAVLLADEGLAVARFERDADWDAFAARPLDTSLYAVFTVSSAELTTTDPGPIDGIFDRTITLENVYRDDDGNISETGITLDESIRRVEATVSWTASSGENQAVTFEAYLVET